MKEQGKQIPIKGIMRNTSIAQTEDGQCDEIINLRFKEGSWRPTLPKVSVGTIPYYIKTYKHPVDYEYDVWIGLSTFHTSYVIKTYINSTEATILTIPSTETFVDVSHIHNYLIIWTDLNRYIFFWDDNAYTTLEEIPNIEMFVRDESDTEGTGDFGGTTSTYDLALAQYLKLVAEKKDNGLYEGNMMVIAAFRLFDGTYVKHTQPFYLQLGTDTQEFSNLAIYHYSGALYGIFAMRYVNPLYYQYAPYFGYPVVTFGFSAAQLTILEKYKGLIASIDIFGTYPKSIYELWPIGSTFALDPADPVAPVPLAPDYNFNDTSISYYLLKSIAIDEIDSNEVEIKLPKPDDFTSKTTLPVDDFSNHKLTGNRNTNYNSRMHIGDTTLILGDGFSPFVDDMGGNFGEYVDNYTETATASLYTKGSTIEMKMFIYLETDAGERIVEQDIEVQLYNRTGTGVDYVILKPFIVYPDIRCNKILLFVEDGTSPGDWSQWINFELTPHTVLNHAFKYTQYAVGEVTNAINIITMRKALYESPKFLTPTFLFDYTWDGVSAGAVSASPLPTADIYLREQNRLQASGINNPFIMPSINSYKVGNYSDIIRGIRASITPASDNQFGQQPLFVFTEGTVYAMQVGTNEALYSSIIPVVNEQFNEDSQFISVKNGVIYTCPRGLKYIGGREITNIDYLIREVADGFLNSDASIVTLLTTPDLLDKLSQTTFLEWLTNAIIAYDTNEDELIVANDVMTVANTLDYDYCYVYSFRSNTWHKRSSGFNGFIEAFPGYYGLQKGSTNYNILNLSQESGRDSETLFITRPIKLSGSGYKKITKGILRAALNVFFGTKIFSLYVYGSVDGKTWKYISGKEVSTTTNVNDMGINKHHISCKYYIFVFQGGIRDDSVLSYFELTFADIANNKLR